MCLVIIYDFDFHKIEEWRELDFSELSMSVAKRECPGRKPDPVDASESEEESAADYEPKRPRYTRAL